MTIELTMLIWSTTLFGFYVGTQAILYRMQHGVEFAATGRDEEPEPNVWNARAQKALRNLIETYPVFLALIVASIVGDRSGALTQWGSAIYLVARVIYLPLYVSGIKYVRSLVWVVSAIGLLMLFFGVAF